MMKDIEREILKYRKSKGKSKGRKRTQLLDELRKDNYRSDWFRSSVIREFLNEFVAGSGVVPKSIAKAVNASKEELKSIGIHQLARHRFLDSLDGSGKIKELNKFLISANDLIASAKNGGEVMKTFADRNIHNSRYYYTKFTEWYITKHFIDNYERPAVVDIGSAYNGFGKYAKNVTNAREINLVDICNPPGSIELEDRVIQIGSDAARIEHIEDGYADIVCLHNAIEHFACGSDDGCLAEIQRMLRPGGRALITPFFFEGRYAISLNPISCFFYDAASSDFVDYLENEHLQRGANIRYSFGMVSPYAHVYDYPTIERKLKTNCPRLNATLYQVGLKEETLESSEVFGVEFSPDLYDKPTFFFLVLEKQNS